MKQVLTDIARKARKLIPLLQNDVYRTGLRYGVAATTEHRAVPLARDIRTVIDIGAHHGQFALFARARYPTAAIHCFEPQPDAFARLGRILGRLGDAQAHQTAIGAESGVVTLHVAASSDSSSLYPIGSEQVAAFPSTREIATLEVPVAPLTAYLAPGDLAQPCLLKVDVQGSELEVLRGCETLFPRISEMLIELSFAPLYVGQPLADSVTRYLISRGFALRGLFGVTTDQEGRQLQADGLFTRR